MKNVHYENIELNKRVNLSEHFVDKEEMVDFFRKWDAKPFHVYEELARFYPVGGLVAYLIHILSVISRLGSISESGGTAFQALLEMERFQIFNPVCPGG